MSNQTAADLRAAADAVSRRDFLHAALRTKAVLAVTDRLIFATEPMPSDAEVIAALRAAADAAEAQSINSQEIQP